MFAMPVATQSPWVLAKREGRGDQKVAAEGLGQPQRTVAPRFSGARERGKSVRVQMAEKAPYAQFPELWKSRSDRIRQARRVKVSGRRSSVWVASEGR